MINTFKTQLPKLYGYDCLQVHYTNLRTKSKRVFPSIRPFSKPRLRLRMAQASLAPRPCFDNILGMLCVRALRASDKRTEPEAESKAEAVVSKRAYENET